MTEESFSYIMEKLGLDTFGCVTDIASMTNVVSGVQQLFHYHFVGRMDMKLADLLGEALMNGEIFGLNAGTELAIKSV